MHQQANKIFLQFVNCRVFEWTMALNMLGQGSMAVFYPESYTQSAFRYLAINITLLAVLLLVFGSLRIAALVVNGKSLVYGPTMRIAGCLAGCFIWSQMGLALIVLAFETQHPSPGIPNWIALTLGEIAAIYQAGASIGRCVKVTVRVG